MASVIVNCCGWRARRISPIAPGIFWVAELGSTTTRPMYWSGALDFRHERWRGSIEVKNHTPAGRPSSASRSVSVL